MPQHPLTFGTGYRWTGRRRCATLLLVPMLLLPVGCLYQIKEKTDDTVRAMAAVTYDPLPESLRAPAGAPAKDGGAPPGKAGAPTGQDAGAAPKPADSTAAASTQMDIQTVAYMQAPQPGKQVFQLHVPDEIPGSEAAPLAVPVDPAERAKVLAALYPPLPPLEAEVKPLPGPDGKAYTLSDFQRIAAENSPTLRQAASDVKAAQGNMIQTAAYANPNVALQSQPSNNSSTNGVFGFTVDQVVNTGGKMRLQCAVARKQLDNAELALRRARSDLSTQVRNAYFGLLVAKETMRVTRGLAVLTDEVYRVQLAYTQNSGQSAAYEPAAMRAQAWAARLAYKQASATYVYAWKTMVAAVGERQLPLSDVSGRIDSFVPYYEYDKVLAHVLHNHTDVLTAMNGIDVGRFNLKYNQVLPYYPNVDFNIGVFKDQALFPFGSYVTFTASAPIPVWDQNRGNIMAAEAALARAMEEPHRVELALTTLLATNYTNYKTNLDAIEYYRRYVLPDQVRAYRGTLLRRQIDVNAQFGDLVAAQQALATSVTTYLSLLGTLWSSVVSVADMLQTEDLFQTAEPHGLPELPDLEHLPPLPCCHPFGDAAKNCVTPNGTLTPVVPPGPVQPMPQPAPPGAPALPPPRPAASVEPQPGLTMVVFKLTDQSFAALRTEKIPEGVLVKLYPLNNRELSAGDFMVALSRVLSPDESRQYQQAVMSHAMVRSPVEPIYAQPSPGLPRSTVPTVVVPPAAPSSVVPPAPPSPVVMPTVPTINAPTAAPTLPSTPLTGAPPSSTPFVLPSPTPVAAPTAPSVPTTAAPSLPNLPTPMGYAPPASGAASPVLPVGAVGAAYTTPAASPGPAPGIVPSVMPDGLIPSVMPDGT